MLLCLSSGITPRYREDVLRAVFMPCGSHLRFRYECELIPNDLLELIKSSELKEKEVCISYLDRSNKNILPEIVPCRKAELLASNILGDFCVLDFKLGNFFFAEDIVKFNSDIRSSIKNLPSWEGESLQGSFCFKVDAFNSTLMNSRNIEYWQKIIRRLKSHSDFF